MRRICCAAVLALALFACATSTIPPVPYKPVTTGNTAKVDFVIDHDRAGTGDGGLFSTSGRIYSVTLHLYQYEGCEKMVRGSLVLKPAAPSQSMLLAGDALLFADVRFHGSKGYGRSDLVFPLERYARYTVTTLYENISPRRYKLAVHEHRMVDGVKTRVPVPLLTYRKALMSAMLSCRDK